MAAGCNVVRMNMRSCGDGEEFSPTIYHAGRSEDVDISDGRTGPHADISFAASRWLVIPWGATWFSSWPANEVPSRRPISRRSSASGAASIWPPPLPRCTNRRIAFTRAGFSAKSSSAFVARSNSTRACTLPTAWAKLEACANLASKVVARYGGFTGADDYYYSVASSNWARNIAVPTLILHALDDPFIRMTPDTRDKLVANPRVMLVETRHGGHCAFLSLEPGDAGFWAERTLLDFLLATVEG